MQRHTVLATLFCCVAAFSAQAETSANIALYSDYLFRGISQTDENPALQGGLDWSHESGFYLGTWASNTDFNPPGQESSGVEVDLYGGYSREIGAVTLSVGIISYQYPSIDANLEEAVVGLSAGGFSGSFYHDWDNDTDYLSLDYEWTLDRDITLGVGGGAFEADGGGDYAHYHFIVGKPFSGFDWSLTISDTDIDGDDVTVLLGISTEFSF